MLKTRILYLLFFLFVQSVFGQTTKFSVDKNLLNEVKSIQKVFSDSVSHYDYKKDKNLYLEKYGVFYQKKIKNLKELYQKQYDKDTMIEEVEPLSKSSLTDIQTKESQSRNTKLADELLAKKIDNLEQLLDLQQFLTRKFPIELFRDGNSDKYRCEINFKIDVDGQFKKVIYRGSDLEFNLISALFIYAVGNIEKPLLYKNKPTSRLFSQPFTLIME